MVPPLHGGGQGFESSIAHLVRIAFCRINVRRRERDERCCGPQYTTTRRLVPLGSKARCSAHTRQSMETGVQWRLPVALPYTPTAPCMTATDSLMESLCIKRTWTGI